MRNCNYLKLSVNIPVSIPVLIKYIAKTMIWGISGVFFIHQKYLVLDQKINMKTAILLSIGCESQHMDQGRSYVDKSIIISNCFFSRMSVYSGNGGVIFVDGGSYSMNVNYSMFFNCACSEYGGAIYFDSFDSILRMICVNRCSASSSIFTYIESANETQITYLSVSGCSYTTSGRYSIYLKSGNQIIDNTNSSMNNANHISCIYIQNSLIFQSSYCTFNENIVSYSSCLFFEFQSGTMSYSNIINNNSPSHGVIFINIGSPKMMYCIFWNNKNNVFYVHMGSLELSHSFIDHLSSISSGKSVSIATNNSFTSMMTYQIQFFNSHYCIAYVPQSTHLNTIEQTPSDSPMPTIVMTEIMTNHITPYRSYEYHSPYQTLFPVHTPYNTHHPVHTPHQSIFSEQTLCHSLFPIHSPYQTYHPDRTNQRSYPLDYNERTHSTTSGQSNNSVDENKTVSLFVYSTIILIMIIVAIISFNLGNKMNHKMSESSSSLDKIGKREEIYYDPERKMDQKGSYHDDHVPSPYVF